MKVVVCVCACIEFIVFGIPKGPCQVAHGCGGRGDGGLGGGREYGSVGAKDERFKPLSQIDSWQQVKCFGPIPGGEPEPYRCRASKQTRWFFFLPAEGPGEGGGDAGRWVEAAKEGVARKTVVDKCEHTRQVFLRRQAPPSRNSHGRIRNIGAEGDRVLGCSHNRANFFEKF